MLCSRYSSHARLIIYSQSSVASATAGLQYRCTSDSGALLFLRDPAIWTHLDCDLHIKRYIRDNISSWQEFANERLGIGLSEEKILFVSGFTKTTVWATAAFADSSSDGELCIAGGCFVPSTSGEFRVAMSRCTAASVFSRWGPPERLSQELQDSPQGTASAPEAQLPRDQCIFLNYYKMKRRRILGPSVLRAAAGPWKFDFDRERDDDCMSIGSTCTSETTSDNSLVFTKVLYGFDQSYDNILISHQSYDPVDSVLDYILQVCP